MEVINTEIEGVVIIEPRLFKDERGYFFESFYKKNRHKAQRKAKFYINKCRSASCMQGGLKQASA